MNIVELFEEIEKRITNVKEKGLSVDRVLVLSLIDEVNKFIETFTKIVKEELEKGTPANELLCYAEMTIELRRLIRDLESILT